MSNTQQKRATDNMDFGREHDEEHNDGAEIDSHKMLYAMYKAQLEAHTAQLALNDRLIGHMGDEEKERKVIHAKLDEITQSIAPLIDSMPRDAHGNPSTFLHRVQHEVQSGVYRSGVVQEGLRLMFIALIVLASTGSLSKFFAKLIG